MSRKWRLPSHLEGKLWIHKAQLFSNRKRNRECYCVVLKDVLYCHSSEKAYKKGEDEIQKILLEQAGGIRDSQAHGDKNWVFKIVFEDGHEQGFSAETKTEMERWVVDLLYAKEYWAHHREEASKQREHSEDSWVIIPTNKEKEIPPVEAIRPPNSTTQTVPVVQVIRCDGRVQSVLLPPVFKAKELYASVNLKPGCSSRELWVVDDSGAERKLDEKINIDVSKTGYQFYLLERDYKLLVVRFEDHAFKVHPATVNIKASEVSRLPIFAKKLRELECTNPGLFLAYESGTEVLFRSDEEPLSLFWDNTHGAWSKKSHQRGTFLLRDKALIIEAPISSSPTWEQIQRENIEKATRTRNEKKALVKAERKHCTRRYPSFENRGSEPRGCTNMTTVGSPLEFKDEHFSSDESVEIELHTHDAVTQDGASADCTADKLDSYEIVIAAAETRTGRAASSSSDEAAMPGIETGLSCNAGVSSGNQEHSCQDKVNSSVDVPVVELQGSQSSFGDLTVSSGNQEHSPEGKTTREVADVKLKGSQSSSGDLTVSSGYQEYSFEGKASRDMTDVGLEGSQSSSWDLTVSSKDLRDSSGKQEHLSEAKVDSSRDMTDVGLEGSQSSSRDLTASSKDPKDSSRNYQEHLSEAKVDSSRDMTDVVLECSQSSPVDLKDPSEPCSARADKDFSMVGCPSQVKASSKSEDVNSSTTTKVSTSGCNTEVNGGVDHGCSDAISGEVISDSKRVEDVDSALKDANEDGALHQCSYYKVVSPNVLKWVLKVCEGSSEEEEEANDLSSICLSGVHLEWVNGSWCVVDENSIDEVRELESLDGERFLLKFGITAVFRKQKRKWRVLFSNEGDRIQDIETEGSPQDNFTSSLSVSPCPCSDSATFHVTPSQPTVLGLGEFLGNGNKLAECSNNDIGCGSTMPCSDVPKDEGQLQSCEIISQVERELRDVVQEIFKHTKTTTHGALDSSKHEVVEDIICRQLCSALEKLVLSGFSRKFWCRHDLLEVLKEFQSVSCEVIAIVSQLSKLCSTSDRLKLQFFVCECLNMQKDTLAVWMEHVLEGKKRLVKYYENDSYILHLLPEARRNIVRELNRLSNLPFRLHFPFNVLRDIKRTEATFTFE